MPDVKARSLPGAWDGPGGRWSGTDRTWKAACGAAWPILFGGKSFPTLGVARRPQPKGSWLGLNASMMALGSPGPAGKPVLRLTRTSLMPGGARNGIGGSIGKRDLEEFADDGRGDIAAGLAMSHGRGIVETDIGADHEVRREADEPAILLVIGGPGLAGDRPLEHLELLRRAALDDAFHDGDHLIGGHRIDDLRRSSTSSGSSWPLHSLASQLTQSRSSCCQMVRP